MSLGMSSSILLNFLNGPHSNKGCLNTSSCGAFSEIYMKLYNVSLQSFGKMTVFVLSDSKSKKWGERKWKRYFGEL